MILTKGNKLLIANRRLFENDSARFFIGEIECFEMPLVKISGYSFAKEKHTLTFKKKSEKRTKIITLDSGMHLSYALPDIDISQAFFEITAEGVINLKVGSEIILDMSEVIH